MSGSSQDGDFALDAKVRSPGAARQAAAAHTGHPHTAALLLLLVACMQASSAAKLCQAQGCEADVSGRPYTLKRRLCDEHLKVCVRATHAPAASLGAGMRASRAVGTTPTRCMRQLLHMQCMRTCRRA